MATLRGLFLADFEDFYHAVLRADDHLVQFAAGADKAGARLNAMVDSFSGKKIIQDATVMAEAIDRIGGTSKLTEAELLRVSSTAGEAAAKLRALGVDVPPALERLAGSVRGARVEGDALRNSFSQFDGVLSSLGVNIAPQVKALQDIAGASATSASELGLLGTAGLAAGAAFAGWEIGRWVAGIFDFDQKIGDATAKLLGWGDAGAAAGAKADVLAKASKTAGYEITSFSVAMAINEGAAKGWEASLDTSARQIEGWRAAIEEARSKGALEGLTHDLQSQNFTMEELERRYGLTTRAIQFFAREEQAAASATKAANDTFLGNQAMLKKLSDELDEARRRDAKALDELNTLLRGSIPLYEIVNQQTQRQIETYLKAGASIDSIVNAKIAERSVVEAVARAYDANTDAMQRNKAAADEIAAAQERLNRLGDGWTQDLKGLSGVMIAHIEDAVKLGGAHKDIALVMGVTERQVDAVAKSMELSNAAMKRHAAQIENLSGKVHTLGGEWISADEARRRYQQGGSTEATFYNLGQLAAGLGVDPSQAEQLAQEGYSFQEIISIVRTGKKGKPVGPRIPGFASGVSNFMGGLAVVGERGPEIVNLPSGADVLPHGPGGALSPIAVNVYVSGVWDSRSERELTNAVSRGLENKLKAQGWRPPLNLR